MGEGLIIEVTREGPLGAQVYHLALQPLWRLRSPPSNLGHITRRIMQAAWTNDRPATP